MAAMASKISELYSLEQLSALDTPIHHIHPLAKLLGTAVYLLCIVSFDRYAFSRLLPYLFYPAVLMSLADIPYGMIARRTLVALPFCLFAGLSNLIFDRAVLLRLGTVAITSGTASFFSILLKTPLCVAAVLILVASTPFMELTNQLRRLRVPAALVSLFEMTYRYIGTLVEEASSMYTAYRLRSGGGKGLQMRHMGSFVGQLLLKSFARAERVYHAMQCRGYALRDPRSGRRRLNAADYAFLLLVCGSSVLFRLIDIPELLGRIF